MCVICIPSKLLYIYLKRKINKKKPKNKSIIRIYFSLLRFFFRLINFTKNAVCSIVGHCIQILQEHIVNANNFKRHTVGIEWNVGHLTVHETLLIEIFYKVYEIIYLMKLYPIPL